MTVCSDDPSKDGTSYCVDTSKGEQCPITELRVYDTNANSLIALKNDPEWQLVTSSAPTDGSAPQLVMAFTRTDGSSNAPVQ